MTASHHRDDKDAAIAAKASKIVQPLYRHLPDPHELNARLWKDPEAHTRLWTDPALRDAYVEVTDNALIDAVTGKEPIEKLAESLSENHHVPGTWEMMILGL
jgi:hypothetical protein